MTTATIDSIAGERIPHGSTVRLEGKKCLLEPDLTRIDGVTKRPHQTAAKAHEKGERLTIQTDGGIMAEIGQDARYVHLRKGKIIEGARA